MLGKILSRNAKEKTVFGRLLVVGLLAIGLAAGMSLAGQYAPRLASIVGNEGVAYAEEAEKPDKKQEKQEGVAFPEMTVPSDCPLGQCIIEKYVNPFVNVFSALVGVAVTISIVYGGIQFASSGGNPQKAAEGRQRITTSIIVLLGYFVFYAFLNWLVPGGVAPI